MPPKPSHIPNSKPVFLTVLENVLLFAVLSLMVLRATYIENPHIEQIQTRFFLTSEIVSLLMTTALAACAALWLGVTLLTNRFRWRKTSLGWAILVFAAAGVISCLAASNKRAAITDVVVLLTPMLCAMLLVQLLTSRAKTHLAVLLVVAIAAAMTAQCIDQFVDSNQAVIQDYERNPAEQLEKLNIEPDSLEHWMYEHRLYSKDIRGFLMTSNSAASFFLLAVFAALGLFLDAAGRFKDAADGRQKDTAAAAGVCFGLALLIVSAGLLLTQSKGGIGAFGAGLFVLAVLTLLGRRLWKYRLAVGIVLLIGIALAVTAVIVYGQTHGRLPGGNSMLVRWQYWQSTAAMIGDHGLTGIGGGNYRFLYPLYKLPAASETIQDPHNFILSLLSQYGPLGLLGFLGAVLWPIYTSLRGRLTPPDLTALTLPPPPFNKKLWLGLLAITVSLLLAIRPMLVDANFLYQRADVRSAAYVVLYLFPAGVFVLAFGLLCAVSEGIVFVPYRRAVLPLSLVCGLLAVLIHNLVDFALFEPGVWNVFWLTVAVLMACRHNAAPPDETPAKWSTLKRLLAVGVLGVAAAFFLAVAVVPPVKANRLFRRAMLARQPDVIALDRAVAADPLSPDTAYNAAGMLMQVYARQRPTAKDLSLLQKAADYADVAQQRNPAGFKAYRLKSDIAMLLAGQAQEEQTAPYLQAAYDSLTAALARYPGSDRILYNLGQIAEQLGRPEEALAHYQQAVAIEQAYREQFKIMYPGRTPVISRLGNTAYTIARAKIDELQKQLEQGQ